MRLRTLIVAVTALAAACSPASGSRSAAVPTGSPAASPSAPTSAAISTSTSAAPSSAVPPSVATSRVVHIGISLPLSADGSGPADAVRDAVLLAIGDAGRTAPIAGLTVEPVVLDHTVNGTDDPTKGTADIMSLVADPTVLGVVGPFNSYIAQRQIPLSSAAQLIQCSPATTDPTLTKGDIARELRQGADVAFLRLAVTDDEIAPAIADYAATVLHAKRAFVVDDGASYGTDLDSSFSARFVADGGQVVGRRVTDFHQSDYSTTLAQGARLHPDVVMFGGVTAPDGDTSAGAAILRSQMPAAGLGGVPLVGGPSLATDDGQPGSLLAIAGAAAKGTYLVDPTPGDYPGRAAFSASFRAAYGHDPDPYAAPGYACAQVILAAIATAARSGGPTREAVRAAATAPGTTVHTILGAVGFDADGDTKSPTVTVYRADPTAGGGKGAWVADRTLVVRP